MSHCYLLVGTGPATSPVSPPEGPPLSGRKPSTEDVTSLTSKPVIRSLQRSDASAGRCIALPCTANYVDL